MKKAILASGLVSIIFSSNSANSAEITPADRGMECGQWIDNVQTCQHYYNGKKTMGITRKHRSKRFRISLIEYAWDGKTFDEALQFFYDDLGRTKQIWYLIGGELQKLYYCTFEDSGIKKSEYVDDAQGQQLYQADDTNEDGKMDYIQRFYYDEQGKLIEKTLDENGDGKVDATWDFQKEEWIPKPAKKVYKPGYYIW